MKVSYYILFFLLLCPGLLVADDLKFTATVSKTEVSTGEQFEITFSINSNADRFTPPDFKGFQILGGPNESNSMTSINGNTSVSNTYSYVLLAVKEGVFTINPASVIVNGNRLTTNAIKIKVVKGRPVPQNSQGQNAPDNSIIESNPSDLSKALFLRPVVDKTNVYQGEQVNLSFRLYTRIGIEQSQVDKLPDLTGFYNQDIKPIQQQVQWRTDTYKGQKYNVADIKQTVLFAEHAGEIKIDPFEMTFIVRVPETTGNIMDQFFGGYKEVNYHAKSPSVVIHVKPLPQAGKPIGFDGAVGNFKIDASVDKNTLKANEVLNYKIQVLGSGNLKLLKPLNINFPGDFERYDPKVTDTIDDHLKGIAGSRFYNYLLIPRHAGVFTIEPVKFSYFNLTNHKYITLSSRSFQIKVENGKAESNVIALSDADKQEVRLLNKDIRYIKTNEPDLSRNGNGFYGSGKYYLMLLAGPFIGLAALIYRELNRKKNSDPVKVKNRKAGKIAAKHLASAHKQLQTNNSKAFYEDVFKGLYGYLSDKLNISSADLNKENISIALKQRKVTERVVTQLLDTLNLCEMARYAPVTHISQQEVFNKAKNSINDIENEI